MIKGRCCRSKGLRPFVLLFDIQGAPYEFEDIAALPENAAIVADLSRQLLDWMRQMNDPLLEGPVRTPYYQRSIQDLEGVAGKESV